MSNELPVITQNGSTQIHQQVAELQQQLAASQQREQIMRQLLNNIPAAIYATGSDGTIYFVNSAFAATYGQQPGDLENRTLSEVFPPEMATAWQQNVAAAISSGETSSNRETYGEHENARHYSNLRFPLSDANGETFALGGVATDITEQVQAEESYADTQLMLEGIVNNSPAVIFVKNPQGKLMLANQAYANVVRRPMAELLGLNEHEIFPAELVERWRESDKELFTTGQPLRSDTTFVVDGVERDFITVQFPLYDKAQRPFAICGISTDVSELRQAEHQRQQLQEEIIEAQRAALRELNTPLIPLDNDVVVMPLIGSIDTARAAQVMETLLTGVGQTGARIAILDVTGLPIIDSQVANALLQTAQAVKLLGAEVVLTGIGPEVAQTLVTIGADLSGIKTPGTLQAGIAYALGRKTLRV